MSKKGKGSKVRAGQLLSQFLRIIAEEKTESVVDPDDGEDRMATKAEALSRQIWKMALGYKEFDVKKGKDIVHKPDKSMMRLVFDRIEGKARTVGESQTSNQKIADKVSEIGKKRINSLSDRNAE